MFSSPHRNSLPRPTCKPHRHWPRYLPLDQIGGPSRDPIGCPRCLRCDVPASDPCRRQAIPALDSGFWINSWISSKPQPWLSPPPPSPRPLLSLIKGPPCGGGSRGSRGGSAAWLAGSCLPGREIRHDKDGVVLVFRPSTSCLFSLFAFILLVVFVPSVLSVAKHHSFCLTASSVCHSVAVLILFLYLLHSLTTPATVFAGSPPRGSIPALFSIL
ncbi:hypothetical protein QBC47DRAFT_29085 [Echria macrotheca]|uniref:Uncharacterized protein n=1 Tax=Echria macrotheca TaxID=438768 RepID=A0AAJ0BQU6_9PEZI|nr:hypothetical protein QBC47DRAFT_29085 [Echria macrotheca]